MLRRRPVQGGRTASAASWERRRWRVVERSNDGEPPEHANGGPLRTGTMRAHLWRRSRETAHPLHQPAGEGLSEAGQLVQEGSVSVKLKTPSVGRKSPVAHVSDMPVGRRFDVEDEIYVPLVCAGDFTAAEDHLTSFTTDTDLAGSEAERHQDGTKDLGDQVESPIAGLSP